MDLMEYKAKELFEKAGIPVSPGITVSSVDELREKDFEYPAVVKAQVQTGGRGKAGGIKFAENKGELLEAAAAVLGMDIKGHTVSKVMVTNKVNVSREFYFSVMLDRNTKKRIMIFSPCGGVDIEQTAKQDPEKIFKLEIDPLLGFSKPDAIYLAGKAGLYGEQSAKFAGMAEKLYKLSVNHYCMLAEINPLIVDESDDLIALDAKISIDDSAVQRLPDIAEYKASLETHPLVKEAADYKFLYIPCDETGEVVVMSNGSGMLMTCIDHITAAGMAVSAVLDLGGGSTAERIENGIRILLSTPNAKILFINIFGGITRCDEVANGIKAAVENHKMGAPILTRFEGTNKDKGLEIIEGLDNVIFADGLKEAIGKLITWKKS